VLEREREVTLRFLAEPTDINFGGKVHGGAVMKWIDQAGYACAVGWSGQYCVTVYVGGIRFYKPVLIGNVVEAHAKLVYTGRTSMHVVVDVGASDPKDRLRDENDALRDRLRRGGRTGKSGRSHALAA
jgi:acyl-CoA hydrolase